MTASPILVVDDDPKIVTLVRTYLEREGFSVVTATNGRAALAAVTESEPRLVRGAIQDWQARRRFGLASEGER
jgi:CheY-like chemotaxis protein